MLQTNSAYDNELKMLCNNLEHTTFLSGDVFQLKMVKTYNLSREKMENILNGVLSDMEVQIVDAGYYVTGIQVDKKIKEHCICAGYVQTDLRPQQTKLSRHIKVHDWQAKNNIFRALSYKGFALEGYGMENGLEKIAISYIDDNKNIITKKVIITAEKNGEEWEQPDNFFKYFVNYPGDYSKQKGLTARMDARPYIMLSNGKMIKGIDDFLDLLLDDRVKYGHIIQKYKYEISTYMLNDAIRTLLLSEQKQERESIEKIFRDKYSQCVLYLYDEGFNNTKGKPDYDAIYLMEYKNSLFVVREHSKVEKLGYTIIFKSIAGDKGYARLCDIVKILETNDALRTYATKEDLLSFISSRFGN